MNDVVPVPLAALKHSPWYSTHTHKSSLITHHFLYQSSRFQLQILVDRVYRQVFRAGKNGLNTVLTEFDDHFLFVLQKLARYSLAVNVGCTVDRFGGEFSDFRIFKKYHHEQV